MKYLKIIKTFKEKNIKVFTNYLFREVSELNYWAAKSLLQRYKKRGLLVSPKRGFYYFTELPPHDYQLANTIYPPSYISFETMLSFYGIIPEVVYPIISATAKPTRIFELGKKSFQYLTIKKSAFSGYLKKDDYLIAEPEKALADYLYFVALGRKAINHRLNLSQINKSLLRKYGKVFKNKSLEKLIKKL